MPLPEIAREAKNILDVSVLSKKVFDRIIPFVSEGADPQNLPVEFRETMTFKEDGLEYSVSCFTNPVVVGIEFSSDKSQSYSRKNLMYLRSDLVHGCDNPQAFVPDYKYATGPVFPARFATLDEIKKFEEVLTLYEKARRGEVPYKEASWDNK